MKSHFRNTTLFILSCLLMSCGLQTPNSSEESTDLFHEKYRPQFHYTMDKGWINDPIGLVYYEGEYHIFNDHNPFSTDFPFGRAEGEQSHWSHAVSQDLVRWKHLPYAVYPDHLGACWSGSGVVDWDNTAGFQAGDEPPIVLAYTSAGDVFGQSLAYSNDHGRTWEKYEGNPIIEQIAPANRDPMVFWHEPTEKWIQVLYVERGKAHFFNSNDLKNWTLTAEVPLSSPSYLSRGRSVPGGFHECPDFFELPVDDDANKRKWVLYDARFYYWIGSFDGLSFSVEEGPYKVEYGHNFYAAQSWKREGRRPVQVGWMRDGDYPGMPFNQQMSFPAELSLRNVDDEIRLFRYPINEIEKLYTETVEITDKKVIPGENLLDGIQGDLFDIELEIEPNNVPEFGIRFHGHSISIKRWLPAWRREGYTIRCFGKTADFGLIDEKIKLRILLDRTSIEIFANEGEVTMSSCFIPVGNNANLGLYTRAGEALVKSMKVHKLSSIF